MRIRYAASAAAAAIALASVTAVPASATAIPGISCFGWHIVPSPSAGQLYAVAVRSGGDVWAVGDRYSGGRYHTLIEHMGASGIWKVVPSPDPATGPNSVNQLFGVVALSAHNAWAVGDTARPTGRKRTLVLHWDGSHWTVAASPNGSLSSNALMAVAANTASNVWAVGEREVSGSLRTLTERWNGSRWAVVPSPDSGPGDNLLFGVSVAPGGFAWAVGSDSAGPGQTLAMRFAAGAWTITPTANPGGSIQSLAGVSAPTAGVALAVGTDVNASQHTRTFGQRWQGGTWSLAAAQNPGGYITELNAIAATSPTDAWAVGTSLRTLGGHETTLAEHWNGTSWTQVSIPNRSGRNNTLNGIAAIPGSNASWVVGGSNNATLIEIRCPT